MSRSTRRFWAQKAGARRSLAAVAIVGVALFAATAASATGPPIVNETDHFANEPDVFVDVNPCDPSQEVEVTSSDTGMIHFSLFADGTVHITGTIRSIVSLDFLPTDGTPSRHFLYRLTLSRLRRILAHNDGRTVSGARPVGRPSWLYGGACGRAVCSRLLSREEGQ